MRLLSVDQPLLGFQIDPPLGRRVLSQLHAGQGVVLLSLYISWMASHILRVFTITMFYFPSLPCQYGLTITTSLVFISGRPSVIAAKLSLGQSGEKVISLYLTKGGTGEEKMEADFFQSSVHCFVGLSLACMRKVIELIIF